MEITKFIFWEGFKILALVLLGVVSAKALAALPAKTGWIRSVLYALVLALLGLGAWFAGNDVGAEACLWSSGNKLAQGDVVKAYTDALQSVDMRPNNLGNWRALVETKVRLDQAQSALDDEPAVRALNGGDLDEADDYQFAVCNYYLGQYDKVVAASLRLIRQNPTYAAPYLLQGLTYVAEQKYPEAQQSFTAVLQVYPSNEAAVQGLAKAYYLGGDRQHAQAVLDMTSKYPFSTQARRRFATLKDFYDQ